MSQIAAVSPAQGTGLLSAQRARTGDLRESFLASIEGIVEVVNATRNAAAVEAQAAGLVSNGPLGANIDVVS